MRRNHSGVRPGSRVTPIHALLGAAASSAVDNTLFAWAVCERA